MEKAMSVDERIRRAEDIYNRRNGCTSRVVTHTETTKKQKKVNLKKLLMQIFICLSIYVIFYAVTNREYIFSEQFRNEVNIFFKEKTKIADWYSNVKGFVYNKLNIESKEKGDLNNGANVNDTQEIQENVQNSEEDNIDQIITDENIGGAEDSTESQGESKDENISEQELMEKTAKVIKENISFIEPVSGRISSTFGWRSATSENVPKYHTGLDIAANEGTVIKSATDGKVVMASSNGDYGNHYQIQIKDVIIVYAHCKKLYLKEGDIVKQGQKIAEVGSTGNSTGPHLHFEIRKGEMKIDPQLIL